MNRPDIKNSLRFCFLHVLLARHNIMDDIMQQFQYFFKLFFPWDRSPAQQGSPPPFFSMN
jgi:hypothetical protein